MSIENPQDGYVRLYIANINTELQHKTLELISLKAQLQLANEQIVELKKLENKIKVEKEESVNTEKKK